MDFFGELGSLTDLFWMFQGQNYLSEVICASWLCVAFLSSG
jgi:hypothetical protein